MIVKVEDWVRDFVGNTDAMQDVSCLALHGFPDPDAALAPFARNYEAEEAHWLIKAIEHCERFEVHAAQVKSRLHDSEPGDAPVVRVRHFVVNELFREAMHEAMHETQFHSLRHLHAIEALCTAEVVDVEFDLTPVDDDGDDDGDNYWNVVPPEPSGGIEMPLPSALAHMSV